MASTFANRDTNWYIRAGGAETNGGGFDPYVSGAGTNYCDQDAAQLSLTDLATAGTSANISSATGGFTSAMIGNVLRIASGTNFTADYYVLTAVTDTNNATVDRNCSVGAGSAGVCKLGGAHAHIMQYASSTGAGTPTHALATPLIAGNTIYIRGTGGADPTVDDYDWSGGYWNFPAGGNLSTGNVRIIGYPSGTRPRIGHQGILLYDAKWTAVEHVKFFQKTSGFTGNNIAPIGWNTSATSYYDCIFDSNGKDSKQAQFGNNSDGSGICMGCEFRNSGGGAAGTAAHVGMVHVGGFHAFNWVHAARGHGFTADGIGGTIFGCLVNANLVNGYKDTGAGTADIGPTYIANNTWDANGGDCLNFVANDIEVHSIVNNIFSNHVGASKVVFNFTDSKTLNTQKYKELIGFNDFYGNTTNFSTVSGAVSWSINPAPDGALVGDLTANPGYANAAGNDFTPGANVIGSGIAKSSQLTTTDYHLNMGAVFT